MSQSGNSLCVTQIAHTRSDSDFPILTHLEGRADIPFSFSHFRLWPNSVITQSGILHPSQPFLVCKLLI